MSRKRPTIADLRAMKGKRQLTMLRVLTMDEAEAAERAGVDIVSVPPELVLNPQYRDAAPSLFTMPGENFFEIGTADDFVRWAFRLYKAGADAVYCSAGYATIKRMADDAIPVIGHVGLIPSRATWTGGFKAVGKTADTAMQVFEAVKQLEAAGAIGAEIEVVPVEVAKAISERTSLIMLSMGQAPAATRSICSPKTYSARTAATCPAIPSSTAISPPNTTGCRRSASLPSRSMSPTSTAERTRKTGTSCTWTRANSACS